MQTYPLSECANSFTAMAAMAATTSIASSSTTLALPTSLSHLNERRTAPVAPTHLCKFPPRASVSCGGGGGVLSSSSDVQPVPSSLWPMASQGAPSAMRSAEVDVMGLLLRQRIVFLGNEMNDFVADAIISHLLLLDTVDPKKEIRLFVNCPGGSISAAMGIFDAMQLCRADVSTICFGLAASTAAIVVAGGTKGRRFAMPNSRIMIHQPLGGASGQAIDVEIQAKEVMYHKSNVTRIFSEMTGRSVEQVEKDIDRDRYMSPIEAMEYGIVDGVIDKDAIIAISELPELSYRTKRREENSAAIENPRKLLTPEFPDDETV